LVSLTIRVLSKQPVPERRFAFISDRSPGNPCPIQIIRANTPDGPKKKKAVLQQSQKKPPTFPPRITRHKPCDISGPTRHWCSGQTINDALHVCVESKMRFLADNHNPKKRQKNSLTRLRLITDKINIERKFAHLISATEQVLILLVTRQTIDFPQFPLFLPHVVSEYYLTNKRQSLPLSVIDQPTRNAPTLKRFAK